MRVLLLAVLLSVAAVARAQDDAPPPLQRYLVDLQLGDRLTEVRRLHPPAREWPAVAKARAGVTRYTISRAAAKVFPAGVETIYVGVKNGRAVEIEVVYDETKSRAMTVEKLAGEYALLYGEAKRSDERFWWSDGRTVLRVFPAEIPIPRDGPRAAAWRTAVQIYDRGLFPRGE